MAAGIKPIIGLEAYLVDDRNADADQATRYERNHLTLLASSDAGFRNLVKLSSAGFLEGFSRGKANVDMELLVRHSEGVIALTGCLQSRFCRRLVEDRPDDARAHIDDLIQAFGPEQVYFEVQRNGVAEQDKANEGIVRVARRSSAGRWSRPPTSTTCAARTTTSHAALLCVQTKSTIEQPKLRFDTNEFYLKSSDEMAESFADMPGGGRQHARDRRALRASRSSSASCSCRASRRPTGTSRGRCSASSPPRACATATETRSRPRRGSGSSSSSA